MKTKVILALLVFVAGTIFLADRFYFASGNVTRVIDAKYGIVAWPASPEFSAKSHSLVRTQYAQDWNGQGDVIRVSRVSWKGLMIHHTAFVYRAGTGQLWICDTNPARLRFNVCGFVPFRLSRELFYTPPSDLSRVTGLISVTTKDHVGYFLLAVRKGERLLNGTEEESTLEFPGEPAYAML